MLLSDDIAERARAMTAIERRDLGHGTCEDSCDLGDTGLPVPAGAPLRSRPMARIRFAAGVLAGAVALRLLTGPGLVNYDTLYALVWGRQLASGTLPDLHVAIAPTPHPLATLAAIVLSPLSALRADGLYGELATIAVLALAFTSLALLGWVVFSLGREWFNAAAGVVAAAIVLTRVPVLDFGARAYVDIPYLVLVLGALLVETRRPRSGAPVLALLALGGLLRPEAWLFSVAYLVWLLWPGVRSSARGGGPRRSAGWRDAAPLVILAASAPLLWMLHDLLLTGEPLHSLTGTRDNTALLGRVTGLDSVPGALPRRLGEILREPVLLAAVGGGLLALRWRRDRHVRLGALAGLLAVAAFCVLAAAGLAVITRYLLLTATLLAIFAGAGTFGWLDVARGSPQRMWVRPSSERGCEIRPLVRGQQPTCADLCIDVAFGEVHIHAPARPCPSTRRREESPCPSMSHRVQPLSSSRSWRCC